MGSGIEGAPSPRSVHVFQAVCRGSLELGREIGLALCHVDVAPDAARAVRRLNEREYGSGVREPDLYQPLGFDRYWNDWRVLDYDPGGWPHALARPDGVRVVEGRIEVSLPPGVTLHEYRERLGAALAHLRLQDVTSEMVYMQARSDACLGYVVQPRYVEARPRAGFRGAQRIDDIYVLDPTAGAWRLFWLVATARAATIGGVAP